VHISDLSWTQKIKHPSDVYTRGQNVEAVVLNVDVENQRFSLGIKQLTPDPWETEIPQRYAVGRIVKGNVSNIEHFGAFVTLEEDIEGMIHISELSDEHIKDPSEVVSEGQEVVIEVINIDRIERRIALALRSTDVDSFEDIVEYTSNVVADSANFSASIGGLESSDEE